MASLKEITGETYEELPYASAAFAATAPEHLQAVAHLFGLTAPEPSRARVLELGSAAGGNLIPFAIRNPAASALGVDLAEAHVRAGTRAIEALRLDNIELRRLSIDAITPELGTFDYIVCHGVYSWVPVEVQDAILRVCHENLAERGVAIISYNTYPGWKAKEIVRDAMMLRAADRATAREKLSYARGMIDFLHDMAAPDSVLKKALDENIGTVRNGADYYLRHEFLEPCNAPCYFRDFLAAAGQHGLGYLADSEPSIMFASNFGRAAGPLLRECGGRQDVLEQLLDFLANRPFRQTLLIHAERCKYIRYRLEPGRLRALHIAGQFSATDAGNGGPRGFTTRRGRTLSVQRAERVALLHALNDAYPATLSVASCLASAVSTPDVEASLMDFIEGLVISGDLDYRLHPVRSGEIGVYPRALDGLATLARLKADTDLPLSLSDAWHQDAGHLGLIERMLLPLLDGQHDHAALVGYLLEQVQAENLHFRENDAEVTDPQRIEELATEHATGALNSLRQRAMLAPASDRDIAGEPVNER